MELNQILHGDCLEVLKTLPDNSIDCCLTDPPYGIASDTKIHKLGSNNLVDFNLEWDRDLPLAWLNEALRVLKPGASLVMFTDKVRLETVWNYLAEIGLHPLQTFYWIKTNPPPQPRKNFCSGIETALFARKEGKINYWGGGATTLNYYNAPIVTSTERTAHPTQKPLSLMKHLIKCVCPVGGVVLDPFLGSGTTAEAAYLLHRNYIGIEKDLGYFHVAKNRLDSITRQPFLEQFIEKQTTFEVA